jgi:hypothetical protein
MSEVPLHSGGEGVHLGRLLRARVQVVEVRFNRGEYL